MHKINVVVDKRTELMGVLLLLSDSYRTKFPNLISNSMLENYYERIQNHFLNFKNHEIVKLIDYFTVNKEFGFGYNMPFDLINQLDKNLSFSGKIREEGNELEGRKEFFNFLKTVSNFIKESKFEEFYKNNLDFYNKYIKLAEEHLSKTANVPDYIKNFYGVNNSNKTYIYNLVFANGYGGGFGYEIDNEVWCMHFLGLDEGSFYFNGATFFLHEFSHPIINPLTDKYFNNNFKLEDNAALKKRGYSGTVSLINESVIRAIELIYLRKFIPDHYEKRLKREKCSGFIHIENFVEFLTEYETNRDKYKTIEDFYPTLLGKVVEIFETEPKEDLKDKE